MRLRSSLAWTVVLMMGVGPRRSRHVRILTLASMTMALLGLWPNDARAQNGSATLGPPAPTPPPTAPAGNWSAWSPVAGPSFLTPALTFNPAASALDLAAVGFDLEVRSNEFTGRASSPPLSTGRLTFLPPVILADATGIPQLLVTGTDGVVTHSRFEAGAWSAPLSTGTMSFLPPAAALTQSSAGSTLELITVGIDGGVRHSRFFGGAWNSPMLLNAVTFLPPTLVANPAGWLELAIIGLDRQVYHARFAGSQWSAFGPTGVRTEVAPALAVSADGVVHLVATGLDRSVVHSRLVNNAWTAPVPTGIEGDLSPALVYSSGGDSLELLARGPDRTVQHGRYVGGTWVTPLSLGITTDARPALEAAAGSALDAAVTGTDGRVYASHFTGVPAPPPAGASPTVTVSFARDIRRILNNNGEQTCTECHSGPFATGGLHLEANQAYGNIVNVASNEQPDVKRVLPGDAANSYLYQKVAGAASISGGRMPLGREPLSASDIELIRQWINAGAPNN
jgi:hypothetical protein